MFSRAIIVALLVAIAGAALYIDPYHASNFTLSDAVEYAGGAFRFVQNGRYELLIDGNALPPRYSPGFPMLFIAPAYKIFGLEPGNAIYPVILFAVVGLLVAGLLGHLLSGVWGMVTAALLVLVQTDYRFLAKEVMTDVPSSALFLVAAYIYILLNRNQSRTTTLFFLTGVTGALGIALRATNAFMILPFLLHLLRNNGPVQRFSSFLLLMLPMAVIAVFTCNYNLATFGSPWRSGFNLWTAVPYDYFSLTFSPLYVAENVSVVISRTGVFPLTLILCALIPLVRREPRPQSEALVQFENFTYLVHFLIVSSIPMFCFYLLYFFPSSRFYLPISSLLCVSVGGLCGGVLKSLKLPQPSLYLILCAVLAFFIVRSDGAFDETVNRRAIVEAVFRHAPAGALIISGIDPAYWQTFFAQSGQYAIMPVSRRIEHASKVIVWKKIEKLDPPAQGPFDHRAEGLLRGGAQEAVRLVALSSLDELEHALEEGKPVFLETAFINDKERAALAERFKFSEVAAGLLQINRLYTERQK